MAFRLPRLPRDAQIADNGGKPTLAFQRWWQSVMSKIETQENAQDDLLAAIVAAQAAANAAQAAADAADAAATSAQTAAGTAQTAADGANAVASLTSSGVSGLTLTATDAGADVTISVSAHSRIYGNGTTLAISGPTSLTGRAYSTTYFIYYDDATRANTSPTFLTTTSEATAAQTGDRHLVGKVTTPAAAGPPENGYPTRPAGVGSIQDQ